MNCHIHRNSKIRTITVDSPLVLHTQKLYSRTCTLKYTVLYTVFMFIIIVIALLKLNKLFLLCLALLNSITLFLGGRLPVSKFSLYMVYKSAR